MKKFIIASMVVIAMLVGIQPVFAEQFIVPEVSTSDSQCFVLDLPAGATVEAPECVAPWQMPEVTETQSYYNCFEFDDDDPRLIDVSISASYRVTVLCSHSESNNASFRVILLDGTNTQIIAESHSVTPNEIWTCDNTTTTAVKRVKVQLPDNVAGTVCIVAQ